MKKILLSAALLATTFSSAMAQDEFKPQAGHATTEFSLLTNGLDNLLSLNQRPGLNTGVLKGRYFLQDNLALRASFGLGSSRNSSKNESANTESIEKNTTFTLGLGAEHHFGGTDRLSPYVGGEVFIGTVSSSTKKITSAATSIVKTPARFLVGADLVLGADYYISRHLFLGAEAGLTLGHISQGKGNTTFTPAGGSAVSQDGTATSKASGIETGMKAGIKIGFVF